MYISFMLSGCVRQSFESIILIFIAVNLVVGLFFLHNKILEQLASLTRLHLLQHFLDSQTYSSLGLKFMVDCGTLALILRLFREGRASVVCVLLVEA